MNKMLAMCGNIGVAVMVVVVIGSVVWSMWWMGKTVSYSFFYEDMVQRTVVQMVKPEYLKQLN